MKKIHLLPNIITAFGLSCGLFVIFKMCMTPVEEVNLHVLMASAGILLLAALADLLDGAVARAMKAESAFGGNFDSLADAISFGVAPSVIVLKSLTASPGSLLSFLMTAGAMVFSVCGVLRLVRYNVSAQTPLPEIVLADAKKKNFTGLPIPAGAAAAVSGNLFLASEEFKGVFTISDRTKALILCFQMFILGYFMISRWKFPSLKNLHIRVASFQVVFATVIIAVFIFYGLLHHFPLVFFVLSWLYVILAWTLSIIRVFSDKKSKTLEDFEPESEEDEFGDWSE